VCVHTYVTLVWAFDNPVDEKGSWEPEIGDYGLDPDVARWEHMNGCKPYMLGEGVAVLAQRLVDDLGSERVAVGMLQRGSVSGPRRGLGR